jgi:hypothetical protein
LCSSSLRFRHFVSGNGVEGIRLDLRINHDDEVAPRRVAEATRLPGTIALYCDIATGCDAGRNCRPAPFAPRPWRVTQVRWPPSSPRAPPGGDGWVHDPDGFSDSQTASSDEPRELTYVDIDTFEATF